MDGDCEDEVERDTSRECDAVALSDAVMLVVVVADGVVVVVTDVVGLADVLAEEDILLEALQLVVPSTVSLGDGSPVFDIVSDSDGVVDGDREDEVERESSRECDTDALSEVVELQVPENDFDVEILVERIIDVDKLLGALPLGVLSMVKVGVGGGVLVSVNDDDGVYVGVGEKEAD